MPRIRCRYTDCIYLEDGFCGTSSIDLDPDEGCMKYTRMGEIPEDEWVEEDEEEIGQIWEEDDEDLYLEDEDDWFEEDDM